MLYHKSIKQQQLLLVEGGLPSAEDGAERGTAWRLMAGRELPCLASRSVPRAAGGDCKYMLETGQHWRCAVAAQSLRSELKVELKHVTVDVVSLAAHAMWCQPAGQTSRYFLHSQFRAGKAPACYEGQHCNPTGKPVSDV